MLDVNSGFRWNGGRVFNTLQAGMELNISEACRVMTAHIQRSMHDPRVSTPSGEAKGHSAPGEVPWVQLGNLRRAIKWTVKRFPWLGQVVGKVGVMEEFANDESVKIAMGYARSLELGAPARNLAPRPYLRPSLDILKAGLMRIIGRRVL